MKKEKCAIRCVGAPAAGAYEGAHFPFQESPPSLQPKKAWCAHWTRQS